MRQYTISENEFNKLLIHVDKKIKHDTHSIKILERLVEGLKSYEGRVLNVKIEKVIQDILPEYSCRYSKRYEHYNIYVAIENERFEYSLIGYTKEKMNKFTLDHLKDKLKDLKEKHEKDKVKSLEITEIVSKYNTALGWFKSAEDELTNIPGWYSFSRY